MGIDGIFRARTACLAVCALPSVSVLVPTVHANSELDKSLLRSGEARQSGDLLKATRILVKALNESESQPPLFINPALSDDAIQIAAESSPGRDVEPPRAKNSDLSDGFVRRIGETAGDITIRLMLYVDAEGQVQHAEIFSCEPEGYELEQFAINEFMNREFYPATRNGEPVPLVHQVKFEVDASLLGSGLR